MNAKKHIVMLSYDCFFSRLTNVISVVGYCSCYWNLCEFFWIKLSVLFRDFIILLDCCFFIRVFYNFDIFSISDPFFLLNFCDLGVYKLFVL